MHKKQLHNNKQNRHRIVESIMGREWGGCVIRIWVRKCKMYNHNWHNFSLTAACLFIYLFALVQKGDDVLQIINVAVVIVDVHSFWSS